MVKNWQEGFDIVYAVRTSRQDEKFVKRMLTKFFYRMFSLVGGDGVSENSSDYRLLSRRAIDALIKLREQHRFMKGLSSWIGFSQMSIPYQPDQRYAGKTKWSYFGLWNLALEAITSFTIMPLKIASFIGLLTAFAAFFYAGIVVFKKLIFGDSVPGYPSLMVIILFLGGIQLITIGIVGEYLGRVFDETKGRPLYFLKSYDPPETINVSDQDNSA
jgi:glycosyltransferase involved in cell wall biosynthesis